MDHRAHGAVEDENATLEGVIERLDSGGHRKMNGRPGS
jgi:hypothetical protein